MGREGLAWAEPDDPYVRLAAIEQRAGIGAAIRSTGADHMVVRTDGDWLLELVRFVAKRRHRAANLGAARVAP